jgi:hypothetical protein
MANTLNYKFMNYKFILLGGVVWSVLMALSLSKIIVLDPIARLFLFAPWVIVPLGLSILYEHSEKKQWIFTPLFFASAFVTLSFFLHPGPLSALCTLPWLGVTGLCALCGLYRTWLRGWVLNEELVMDIGLIDLFAGAIWLLLSRLGATPMGFAEPIILLTAVHFHFAGFAATVITGATGRYLRSSPGIARKLFPWVAVGVVAGMPTVAAGFVLSPLFKIIAIFSFTISLIGLILLFFSIVPSTRNFLGNGLLMVSGISLLVSTMLAVAYGLEEFRQQVSKDHLWAHLVRMIYTHGILNTFGFTLCGLLGWAIINKGERPCASR